ERNKRGRTIQRKDNKNPILLYSIDKKKSSSLGIKIQIRYFFGKTDLPTADIPLPAGRFCGYCGKILPAALRQPESMADRASSALP
ncbi:MAG: hypothetical protein SPK62_01085, partial [Gemmiger sp.]